MRKYIFNKENLLLLFAILIGSTFFLSALGKYFDLAAFKKSMSAYGLPSFTVFIILFIESFFAICFMFLFFLRKASAISVLFLILMTIIYSLGHFIYGISSCDCFGAIDFLNPDNFIMFTVKNCILIIILFYVFKNYALIKNRIWFKRFLTVLTTCLVVFSSLKYNEYYFDTYAKNKIGLSIRDLQININEIENFDYLFVFSPACSHCKEAIPNIISLKKKYSLKLAGITLNSMETELKKLTSDFDINFTVIKIDKNIFNELTKIVPIIFKIKNDTIRNSFNPRNLLPNIISTEKVNFATHLPY